LNPSHAPEGHSTLCLSCKAPYRLSGGWNAEARRALADRIICQTEQIIPDLRRRLVLEMSSTPLTIERMTGNKWGAAYGWAQVPRQAGIYRLNRVAPIDRLYLAGHWTAPGGGVAAAVASGQITANLTWNRLKGEG
jgi:prolycopene isomerase